MIEIFINGGWSMFPVALLGLVACAAAVRFAMRPDSAAKSALGTLSVAESLVAIGGLALNLATVGYAVSNRPEWANNPAIVMQGVAESLGPVIFGAALLGLAWAIAAIGSRKPAAA